MVDCITELLYDGMDTEIWPPPHPHLPRPPTSLRGDNQIYWLRWGLTTRQSLCVILCRLPEKKEKREGMKERDRREKGKWMKMKKQKKQKHSSSTLICCKNSRPCPHVSQYQLDAPFTQDTHFTFASPKHLQEIIRGMYVVNREKEFIHPRSTFWPDVIVSRWKGKQPISTSFWIYSGSQDHRGLLCAFLMFWV